MLWLGNKIHYLCCIENSESSSWIMPLQWYIYIERSGVNVWLDPDTTMDVLRGVKRLIRWWHCLGCLERSETSGWIMELPGIYLKTCGWIQTLNIMVYNISIYIIHVNIRGVLKGAKHFVGPHHYDYMYLGFVERNWFQLNVWLV